MDCKSNQTPLPAGGHHVRSADIDMYFEIVGQGEPVLFIHAGFHTSEMWRGYVERISSRCMVITPDSRGHGRSSAGSGPITYGRMASDMVHLLDHLGIEQTHVVGHSDGGVITLHMLVDFPDRIKSATLIGTPYNVTNYTPDGFERLKTIMSRLQAGEDLLGFKSGFERLSPDPSRYKEVVSKLTRTYLSQPFFNTQVLQTITPPVLVIKVDKDEFIKPQVFDDLATSIPNGLVLHIPEGKHSVPDTHATELSSAILAFVEKSLTNALAGQ